MNMFLIQFSQILIKKKETVRKKKKEKKKKERTKNFPIMHHIFPHGKETNFHNIYQVKVKIKINVSLFIFYMNGVSHYRDKIKHFFSIILILIAF